MFYLQQSSTMHLPPLLLWATCPVFGVGIPNPTRRGISASLLTSLIRLSEHSSASGCKANHNTLSVCLPIYCEQGYCPLIATANTEILYVFSGIFPGDTTGYIAADHTNALLVISFRDTMSDANRHTDFQFLQVDASDSCLECRAHMGFWLAAKSAYQTLAGLGGALATLYAVFLRGEGVKADLVGSVYRALSSKSQLTIHFSDSIYKRKELGANYRVTHLDDEIPKLLYHASREPVIGR
ncbi:hypothetical protein BJX70DRAFT_91592 [Aspergillus crustosus]